MVGTPWQTFDTRTIATATSGKRGQTFTSLSLSLSLSVLRYSVIVGWPASPATHLGIEPLVRHRPRSQDGRFIDRARPQQPQPEQQQQQQQQQREKKKKTKQNTRVSFYVAWTLRNPPFRGSGRGANAKRRRRHRNNSSKKKNKTKTKRRNVSVWCVRCGECSSEPAACTSAAEERRRRRRRPEEAIGGGYKNK